MPATEQVWRNLKTMHVVFAWSCLAMLAATVWMLVVDFDDEWVVIQDQAAKLEADRLESAEAALATTAYQKEKGDLEAKVQAAKGSVDTHQDEIEAAKAKVDQREGEYSLLVRKVRFQRAERDKRRADFDLSVRDNAPEATQAALKASFDAMQKTVDGLEAELQQLETTFNNEKKAHADLTRARDEAAAELKKHEAEMALLEKARQRIEPDATLPWIKRKLVQLPIIEAFGSPYRIQQIWLPELTINLGGMADSARFDRCTTCHVNIDRLETGNIPTFPHDPHGLPANKDHGGADAKVNPNGYRHPFSTHPNPDLYLASNSPHAAQKFGCTSCHDGQGSGTSFQNASHSPNDPGQEHRWEEKYKWFHNHFWEYPMLPKRLEEAACIKCHHNVVELGVHPKFGASAPKAFEGYELIRKYGCFGCHEINGYAGTKPIGPDLRLEPPTPVAAARIAADPQAVAGTMRKVGPGLLHFAQKTTPGWAGFWIEEPKRFRPDTRMPQFFKLTNQVDLHSGHKNAETGRVEYNLDPHSQKFMPVEIAGMVKYLFDYSTDARLDDWGDYKPDVERGKNAFSKRGCVACHKHDVFSGITADFGPDLSNVHLKIKSGKQGMQWVYSWIRDPQRHHPRSKMPDLFLDPEGSGDNRIDPAADIAAFLVEKGPGDYQLPDVGDAELDELVRLYLNKVVTKAQTEATMSSNRYPIPKEQIKGDEIELFGDSITRDMKLRYVGRRTISRYGCYGCHDIAGFEKARPIGTALQDWGRKDPTKLAMEHIEEFLHHHGEPDGSSTSKRLGTAARLAVTDQDKFNSMPNAEADKSGAFFYEQLLSHGRAGFLWQKLRDPRSYDFEKVETKGYDERLRMPKFPLNEQQIEAIATFVLGLVAEPPAEKFVYRPKGAALDRIEGEKLLTKFNCIACHVIDLPQITQKVDPKEYRFDLADHDKFHELLDRVKEGSLLAFVRGVDPDRVLNVDAGEPAKVLDRLRKLTDDLEKAAESTEIRLIDGAKLDELHLRLDKAAGEEQHERLDKLLGKLLGQLAYAEWTPAEHTAAADLLMKLKAPAADVLAHHKEGEKVVSFRGLLYQAADPQDDPADQEFAYDLWETRQIGHKLLLPGSRMLVPALKQAGVTPARGGSFAEWLVGHLKAEKSDTNTFLAWQASPPPLYQEGLKVQTPWLYKFLKNPHQIRFTTVLRMPRFNMSDDEAMKLANYFSAVDGSAYPYQDVPQREPTYLAEKTAEHLKYLGDSWKMFNAPLCIKCHALGGRPYQGDPAKDIQGPNLNLAVERLRPDWTLLWLYKPAWITPYTSMPAPLPRNQTNYPEFFKGDARDQTIAIRDALMNYHRLMEQEGKVVVEGPAAPGEAKKEGGE
jgi:cytochrome c2